jgi:hypothetical protein
MHIRPDLQTFARACERLLSLGLEPELSPDEKEFVMYYAAELVNKFGISHNEDTHHDNLAPNAVERQGSPPRPTEQST